MKNKKKLILTFCMGITLFFTPHLFAGNSKETRALALRDNAQPAPLL